MFGMNGLGGTHSCHARVIATPVLRYGRGSKEATIVSHMYGSIIGRLNNCHIVAPSEWAMEYVSFNEVHNFEFLFSLVLF